MNATGAHKWITRVALSALILVLPSGAGAAAVGESIAVNIHKTFDAETYDDIYRFVASKDLYRAYITDPTYHWGSNQPRACNGNSNLDVLIHGLPVADPVSYRERAAGPHVWPADLTRARSGSLC